MKIIELDNPENFDLAPTAEEWSNLNRPRENLIYGDGQKIQIDRMLEIAERLGVPVRFPSYHVSKSVRLPVAAYKISEEVVAVVRDNFYDVNIAVRSERPLQIRISDLYDSYDRKWYEEHKRRANDYSPGKYDFSTIDWFKDWSSGSLIQDEDSPNIYYLAQTTFLEGISDLFSEIESFEIPYNPTSTLWAVSAPALLVESKYLLSDSSQRSALSILKAVRNSEKQVRNSRSLSATS